MELPSYYYQIIFWIIYISSSIIFINIISLGRLSIKRFLKDSKYEATILEFWIENIECIILSYFILKLLSLIGAVTVNSSVRAYLTLIVLISIAFFEIMIFVLFYQKNYGNNFSLYGTIIMKSILFPYFMIIKSLFLVFSKTFFFLLPSEEENKFEMPRENEIEDIIIEDTNLLDKDERKMIMSIIQFNDTTVKEVMTPRTELATIEVSSSARHLIDLINKEGHSRIPVFEANIDNIIGIFYAKDILKQLQAENIDFASISVRDYLRTPYFVPETKNISTLLKEFMRDEVHIAIVVDEYGGTAGVVSIEDLIEEIVGEIRDEYDYDEDQMYKKLEDNSILFDAKADIEILEELFDIDVPEDDFESIGGLVFSLIGRVPKEGETLEFQNLTLEIIEADDRKISKIKVKKILQI